RNGRGQTIRVQELVMAGGGVCRVARDVSAEYRGQEALNHARKLQRIAVTEGPMWGRREADGRLVYAAPTDGLKLALGLPADFPITDQMTTYSRIELTQEEVVSAAAAFEESARMLAAFSMDFRTHALDGALKWIRVAMHPVPEPNDAILWSGVMRDVTREKAAEDRREALRAAGGHSNGALLHIRD